MITINTKYGTLYADYDEERINIYDSNQKWLDYISLERLDNADEIIATKESKVAFLNNRYNAYNSVEEMLEQEGIDSYTISEDWTDLIEDIFLNEYEPKDGKYIDLSDGSEITKEHVTSNDFCNKIGSTYILLTEF